MDPDQLKQAYKALRKKLKLMRQDDESRLGHGAMTGGHESAIVGIRPPPGYPNEVWEELVKDGRLRYEGNGLYAIPTDRGPMQ